MNASILKVDPLIILSDFLSEWSPRFVKLFEYRSNDLEAEKKLTNLCIYNTISLCFSFGTLIAIFVVKYLRHRPYILNYLYIITILMSIDAVLRNKVLPTGLLAKTFNGFALTLFISVAWYIYLYYMLNIILAVDTVQRESEYRKMIFVNQILIFFVTIALSSHVTSSITLICIFWGMGLYYYIKVYFVHVNLNRTDTIRDLFSARQNRAYCAMSAVSLGASLLQHFLYMFIGKPHIFDFENIYVSAFCACIFGLCLYLPYNITCPRKIIAMPILILLLFCLNYFSRAFGFLTVCIFIYASMELVRILYGWISNTNISPYYSLKHFFLVNFVLSSSELAYRHLDVCLSFHIMNLLIKLLFWKFCTYKPVILVNCRNNQLANFIFIYLNLVDQNNGHEGI
ncbi:hypothetical protein ENBRE01_1939 [Enteropsectra breve]|nr:hypothetical protein ENBRE01_1939 [Enteropsectra breve]